MCWGWQMGLLAPVAMGPGVHSGCGYWSLPTVHGPAQAPSLLASGLAPRAPRRVHSGELLCRVPCPPKSWQMDMGGGASPAILRFPWSSSPPWLPALGSCHLPAPPQDPIQVQAPLDVPVPADGSHVYGGGLGPRLPVNELTLGHLVRATSSTHLCIPQTPVRCPFPLVGRKNIDTPGAPPVRWDIFFHVSRSRFVAPVQERDLELPFCKRCLPTAHLSRLFSLDYVE